MKIPVSIGIMAYNEEGNIGKLLENLLKQRIKRACINEIIVVASGCTDNTHEIIKALKQEIKRSKDQEIIKTRDQKIKRSKIRLIIQKKREGKAKAINRFIKEARNSVLVMVSADVLLGDDAIEKLVSPFSDPKVGMTAGHIIPLNDPNTFMGFYHQVFWKLHHLIAKQSFKAGELVCWRNIITSIHPDTSTDETNIAGLIQKERLKCVYVGSAMVYNKGPENIAEFLAVRRRHIAAYYHLRAVAKVPYLPPTMDNKRVLKLYFGIVGSLNPSGLKLKKWVWVFGVIGLEVVGRILAWYDWTVKREHHAVWKVAKSTKKLK